MGETLMAVDPDFDAWWELEVCKDTEPWADYPSYVRKLLPMVRKLCELSWREGRACGILDGPPENSHE